MNSIFNTNAFRKPFDIALAGFYVVVLLLSIQQWSAGHQLGFEVDFHSGLGVVTDIFPGSALWGAGSEVGDIIISVDGNEFDQDYWIENADSGKTATLQNPVTGRLTLASQELPDSDKLIVLVPFIVIASAFAGLWIVVQVTGGRGTNPILLKTTAIAVATAILMGSPAILARPLALTLEGMLVPVSLGLLFATVTTGLSENSDVRNWRVAASVVAVSIALLVALSQLFRFLQITPYEISQAIQYLFMLAALIGVIVVTAINYVSASDAIQREKAKSVAVAFGIGVGPFLFLSIIPFALTGTYFLRPEFAIISFVILPIALGYMVISSETVRLRRFMHHSVAVSVLVFGVVLFHGLAALAIKNAGSFSGETEAIVIWVVLGGLIVLAITAGTFQPANRITNFLLYRISVNHGEIARLVTTSAAREESVDSLARAVMSTVKDGLQLESARMVEIAPIGPQIVGATDAKKLPETESKWIRQLEIEEKDSSSYIRTDDGFTLKIGVSPAYYAIFGRKQDGSEFDGADIQLIDTVHELLSIAVNRLSTLTQLNQQSDDLREISQKLVELDEHALELASSEIHDEPLQELYYLISRSNHEGISPEHRSKLVEVANHLRKISSSLSPLELRDFGLSGAIESLVDQLRERMEIEAKLTMEGIGESDRFSNKVELSVYRVIQEVLSNISKHSTATATDIHVDRDFESINIVISDNGIGISEGISSRLGLSGMRARVLSLSGDISIEPNEPSGTNITVRIPHQDRGTNGA